MAAPAATPLSVTADTAMLRAARPWIMLPALQAHFLFGKLRRPAAVKS